MTEQPADQEILFELHNQSILPSLEIPLVGHFTRKYKAVDRVFTGYSLAMVLQGKGWFRWKGQAKRQRIEAPFYFYGEPGVHMCYRPDAGSWWEERYFAFRGIRPQEWKSQGWIPIPQRAYPLPEPAEASRIHQEVFDALMSRDPDRIGEAKLQTEQLVFRLHVATRHSETTFGGQQRLENLAKLWRQSPEQSVDLVKAAMSIGLSYSRFRHVFREKFQVSPYQYLLQLRIQKAQHWLRDHSCQVKEAAHLTGFKSMEGFDRAFRREVGMSPTEFRQRPLPLF